MPELEPRQLSQLPPLQAIRVFEAVARHLSFTKAAGELGMTQAAASYQIKLLEERRRRAAVPAAAKADRADRSRAAPGAGGQRGLRLVERGLCRRAHRRRRFALCLDAADLCLQLAGAASGFVPDRASVAGGSARYVEPPCRFRPRGYRRRASAPAAANWPGMEVHKLFDADFTPMLSPKLAASIGGVKEPADLLRLPILDPGDIWWKQWFAAAGRAGRGPGETPRHQHGRAGL